MNKKALSLAICLAMAIPTASNALSLGDIESKSSLNQPFQGRITLLQTNPAEVKSLRVRVASPEVFNRVGIDRPAFLNSIQFRTTVQNGRPVILVSSNKPINEPFLNFLLEVSWPNGQLLKEYTVLLDPPALLRPNTAIASNNAGIRAEPRVQGRINRAPQPTPQQVQAQRQRQAQFQRQAQAQQQRLAQQQQTQGQTQFQRQAQQALQNRQVQQARRVAAAPANRNYRVRRGDTLSKIASRLGYNGVRQDQMMVALFEKNRRAFSRGNMNNLKAGAVMARPSLQEARSLTARAARSQIIAQARAWKAKRVEQLAGRGDNKTATNKTESARLEVLGKTNTSTANNSSSNGNAEAIAGLNQKLALLNESLTTKQQENIELKSRVSELESLLRKKNRLIALKSEQLAGLQSSLSGDQSQQAADPQISNGQNTATPETIGEGIQNQVTTELASENGEIVRAIPETAIVDNSVVPDPVIEPVVEPEVAQQEEASNAFKPEAEAGFDIMGLISSPVGLAAGAGSLGLLGLLALMRRRKNKGGEELEDFSDLIDNGLNDQEFDSELAETDIVRDSVFDESEYIAHDDEVSSQEAAVNENDDELEDLIQEADVYIVYGLHDQAESEIKRALNSYPKS
ncbi:MAG: FimV/HubP family polar landmark protein, partial [Cocleimonas sp.]